MDAAPSEQQHDEALADKAKATLTRCGNCAQASFAVLQGEFDLEGGAILKALTPFPGIALRGETCGAIVGSLMAIGIVYGREDLDDWKGYIGSLPSARRFCRAFEAAHGSTACATILRAKLGRKFNLADQAGAVEYASAGGPGVCGEVVASAVLLAAGIIRRRTSPPASSRE